MKRGEQSLRLHAPRIRAVLYRWISEPPCQNSSSLPKAVVIRVQDEDVVRSEVEINRVTTSVKLMPLDHQLEQGLTTFLDEFTRDAVKDVKTSDSLVEVLNAIAAVAHRVLGNAAIELNTSVRLNAIPTEVLCHVLSFLALGDLIVATHVCQRWREAALAEPSLWTDIALRGNKSPYRGVWTKGEPWTYPELLEDLLGRARTQPVRLAVYSLEKDYMFLLCGVLRKHLHHIRALKIESNTIGFIDRATLPEYTLPYLTDRHWGRTVMGTIVISSTLCMTAPMLEELELVDGFGHLLPKDLFTYCPKLRTLTLSGYEISADTPPVTSVEKLKLVRAQHSEPETSTLTFFEHFPNMRELDMTGVARPFPLPRMGPTQSLDRLTVEPKDTNYQFKGIREIAPARIAHISVKHVAYSAVRDLLSSLGAVEHIELVFPDAQYYLRLHAHSAGGARTRDINSLCTRVVGQIFSGWQPACFNAVTSVVVSDTLPWSNVLAMLAAISSAQRLTFTISEHRNRGLVESEKFYDDSEGDLLFDVDATDFATFTRLPTVQVLHIKAKPPIPLGTLDPEPDEVSLGGHRASRVSAASIRALVSRFPTRLDELILDGVVVREGFEAEDVTALRAMVHTLVVNRP